MLNSQITAMPTFIAIKAGKEVARLRGADVNALNAMVAAHSGPKTPVPPLPEAAERGREKGNVRLPFFVLQS